MAEQTVFDFLSSSPWVAVSVFSLIVVAGLVAVWRRSRASGGRSLGRDSVLSMECTTCGNPLIVSSAQLTRLSYVEMGLVVRSLPKLVGQPLGEYICPHCRSSHCFVIGAKKIEYAGANLYSPEELTMRCMECRKLLKTPPWAQGTYDGRLAEAPHVSPDYGLRCSRCDAVCCYECCVKATRNRTKDGSLLCPRCFRGPVDKVLHTMGVGGK